MSKINAFESSIQALSDAELRNKTEEFRARLGKGETIDSLVPETFAVVRQVAVRTLGQRHFDVQLSGGLVLYSGAIAEMKTGEGKTLVATLPAYTRALSGKGVHIVTVNDYLSRRDAVWMGQIYDMLGLSVGVIGHESSFIYDSKHRIMKENPPPPAGAPPFSKGDLAADSPFEKGGAPHPEAKPKERGGGFSDPLDKERDQTGAFHIVHEYLRPCSRREAYNADITYGTNNEFGFDYLRDNLEYSPERLRQRDPHYAIVDEIDSILIDEARTPLIISAPSRDAENIYRQFATLVASFIPEKDYAIDEKRHGIALTSEGIAKAEKALGLDNIYTQEGIKSVHHLETAIKARALYHKDKEYVVREGAIVIVDEFTGRLQPGRRWSDGLHQAVEAKEGVRVEQESRTYASITFQNFFRMYPKLSGMTGTAATSAEEFFKVYGLEVFTVPTNKSSIRIDHPDLIFRTEAGKFKAIARTIKELNTKGQPVLVGTVSIEKNELLSQFLRTEGVPHQILNAKNHEKEGEIIAQAGKKSGVTIATNMAGRGVDVKLGGNPNTSESYDQVKSTGGLFVLGTERHEARRIDNQLRGRSGRQGDPGETQFFVSLEDSLMRVFASDTLKSMIGRLGMPEDEPIHHKLISRALESAQEKIEGFHFDSRKHVLEFDDVINHQRKTVYGRRRKLLLGTIDDVENELKEMLNIKNPPPLVSLGAPPFPKGESPQPTIKSPFEKGGGLIPNGVRYQDGGFSDPSTNGRFLEIIDSKTKQFGREAFLSAMRIILLQTIDMYWVEHLEVMDYTRSSVSLRAYGQRDPLVEYKKEGLRLFKEMQTAMRDQISHIIPNIVPVQNGPIAPSAPIAKDLREVRENADEISGGDRSSSSTKTEKPEIGRNDPCPCGSGKKYKKCHGK